jgi:hypothetical protein
VFQPNAVLATEAAADLCAEDSYRSFRNAENIGECRTNDESFLRRGPDRNLFILDFRDAGVRFHVTVVHPPGPKCVFEHMLRLAKASFHVAAAKFVVMNYVGFGAGLPFPGYQPVGLIASHFFVNQRRAITHRLENIKNPRGRIVLDLDEPRRFFRGLLVYRCNSGDRLCRVADLVAGKNTFVFDAIAEASRWHIGCREDRLDAGHAKSPGHIDPFNFAAWD